MAVSLCVCGHGDHLALRVRVAPGDILFEVMSTFQHSTAPVVGISHAWNAGTYKWSHDCHVPAELWGTSSHMTILNCGMQVYVVT